MKDVTSKISFCISSSGREELLRACVKSIESQIHQNYEILVGWPKAKPLPDKMTSVKTFRCENHIGKTRNCLKSNASGNWLIFLDEDTELPKPEFVSHFLQLVQGREIDVLGGFYSCSSNAGIIDRAYNMTCNLWLLRSQLQGPQVLGGIYALRGAKFPDYYDGYSFGGEEYPYFSELIRQDSKIIVSRKLNVLHKPNHSLTTFFKRARLHGRYKPLEDITGQRLRLFQAYKESFLVKFLAGSYFLTVYASHLLRKMSYFKSRYELRNR